MNSADSNQEDFTRRKFLTGITRGLVASAVVSGNAGVVAAATMKDSVPLNDEQLKEEVKLTPLSATTEQSGGKPPLPYSPEHRVGIAIVGLGHLSIGQILPAFGASKRVRLAGLVSGDPAKAKALGDLYGVPAKGLYNYQNYESMRDNPEIEAVYVVLPNVLHAEYTIRAAAAGKHVLCEKPMAIKPEECERMIAACQKAYRKLMIAYRI